MTKVPSTYQIRIFGGMHGNAMVSRYCITVCAMESESGYGCFSDLLVYVSIKLKVRQRLMRQIDEVHDYEYFDVSVFGYVGYVI